jgi:hypothetical protein
VLYGYLTFTSPSGLREEYQISNTALAERFAKAWNAFHQSFSRADASGGQAVVQSGEPVQPVDVEATFADESALARSLALQHGEAWEFRLTEELLRSRLKDINQEYSQVDAVLRLTPKMPISGAHYGDWLRGKFDEPTLILERLARSVDSKLATGLGQPGESGDAIEILKAVNDIAECCRAMIRWEIEICGASVPERLKPLGDVLRGFAGGTIADVQRLAAEFASIVEGIHNGTRKFTLNLTFSTPPQVAVFMAELKKFKNHPEWFQ